MSASSINDFLTEDHDRLDGLLETFQEWRAKDFAKAKDFLTQFRVGLQRHLRWEEAILFPLFEQKAAFEAMAAVPEGDSEERTG